MPLQRLAFAAVGFLLVGAAVRAAAPPVPPPLVIAAHLKGRLYLLKEASLSDDWLSQMGGPIPKNQLLQLPLLGARKGKARGLPTGECSAGYSLHLFGGHVLVSHWAASNPTLVGAFPLTAFHEVKRQAGRPLSAWISLRPISVFALQAPGNQPFGLMPSFAGSKDARHDFSTMPDGRLRAFLAWRGELTAWDGTVGVGLGPWGAQLEARWDAYADAGGGAKTPAPSQRARTPIRERFAAFSDAGNAYFVTNSGQVHHLPRKGGPKSTTLLWDDPDRPVGLVVSDAATGRAFAFALRRPGADPKKKPDVFFLLQPKLAPLPAGAPALSRTSPGWRPGVARQYASLLLRKGLIKEALAPPKVVVDESAETVADDFDDSPEGARAKYTAARPWAEGAPTARAYGEVAFEQPGGSLQMTKGRWTVIFKGPSTGRGKYARVMATSVSLGRRIAVLEGKVERSTKPFK